MFFCQLNCAEVADFHDNELIPQTGMLYFFRNASGINVGGINARGSNPPPLVYYYGGDINALKPYEAEPLYPERKLSFLRAGTPDEDTTVLFCDDNGTKLNLLKVHSNIFNDTVCAWHHAPNDKVWYSIDKNSLAAKDFAGVQWACGNDCSGLPIDGQTPEEIHQIGKDYRDGKNGKKQDWDVAMKYIRASAERGCVAAQVSLGFQYDKLVSYDPKKEWALYWYHKAAEAGDADAKYNIGLVYSMGVGVEPDFQQAIK